MAEYYESTPVPLLVDITSLISFHYFEYVKNFHGVGERHDFWEFVYIDYGEVEITANDQLHHASAGESFLHKPNEYHNIKSTGDFSSSFIISFESGGEILHHLSGRILKLYGKEAVILERLFEQGKQIFQEPYDIFDQKKLVLRQEWAAAGPQIMKSYLEMFFILLAHSTAGYENEVSLKGSSRAGTEEKIVDQVIGIISDSVYQRITLDEICHHLSFSKSYILKVFKSKMGRSVMDYYNLIKIKEAKRLISESRYTYTEIAALLNYSSIHHFSKHFKKVTKMTPSGYQKSLKSRMVI